MNDYITAIRDAGFEDVEVQASYWDEAIVDEAVKQLDPELQAQIEQAKQEGRGVMILQEDVSQAQIFEIEPDELPDFDPQKAVFSARVTAIKPE